MTVVAVVGASGLVGGAVEGALRGRHVVRFVSAPRLRHEGIDLTESAASALLVAASEAERDHRRLVAQFEGVDVVVIAAGVAHPDSQDTEELFGGNALMPVVVANAASEAGVRRLVHVSSAAVQGSRALLDESSDVAPVSEYGTSKAAGEIALGLWAETSQVETVLYRPGSVVALDRQVSLQLIRIVTSRIVPMVGGGRAPQPLCLLENVGEAVAALVRFEGDLPRVVVHPWEGMSVRELSALSDRSSLRIPVPGWVVRIALRGVRAIGRGRADGFARRAELYAFGQRTVECSLDLGGSDAGDTRERYRQLVRVVRSETV